MINQDFVKATGLFNNTDLQTVPYIVLITEKYEKFMNEQITNMALAGMDGITYQGATELIHETFFCEILGSTNLKSMPELDEAIRKVWNTIKNSGILESDEFKNFVSEVIAISKTFLQFLQALEIDSIFEKHLNIEVKIREVYGWIKNWQNSVPDSKTAGMIQQYILSIIDSLKPLARKSDLLVGKIKEVARNRKRRDIISDQVSAYTKYLQSFRRSLATPVLDILENLKVFVGSDFKDVDAKLKEWAGKYSGRLESRLKDIVESDFTDAVNNLKAFIKNNCPNFIVYMDSNQVESLGNLLVDTEKIIASTEFRKVLTIFLEILRILREEIDLDGFIQLNKIVFAKLNLIAEELERDIGISVNALVDKMAAKAETFLTKMSSKECFCQRLWDKNLHVRLLLN